MIIIGFRRGHAEDFASYLLRQGKNESVQVREIECGAIKGSDAVTLHAALKNMASQAKPKEKSLYHAVFALNTGEKLSPLQLGKVIDYYAANLGLSDHHRVVVEHHKNGKSHFHIVFNLVHPKSGKLIVPLHPYKARRKTAEFCAQEFGFSVPRGNLWPIKRWEYNRGKRTGIDPALMRAEISAIYRLSATGGEFIARLARAGYFLSRGRNNNYILIDRCKDIHPLSRRLEGVTIAEFEKKFPDLKNHPLTPLECIPGIKERQPHIPKQLVVFKRYASTLLKNQRIPFIPPYSIRSPFYKEEHKFYPFSDFCPKPADLNIPDGEKIPHKRAEMDSEELLAWAWAHKRFDLLAEFGIYPSSYGEQL